MRIGLQTWGSDGDIRPFMALAGGLSAAGHDVTLAVTSVDNKDYTSLGEAMNFRIVRAHGDFDIDSEKVDSIFRDIVYTRDLGKQITLLFDVAFEPAVENMYAASEALCRENDIVIGHHVQHTISAAAEKYNRPRVSVHLVPATTPSKYLTPMGVFYLGEWMNILWWKLAELMTHRIFGPSVNRLREDIGLKPVKNVIKNVWSSRILNLVATSPVIRPRPADWPDNTYICGFFNVPDAAENWAMPDDLKEFLDDSEAPVYFTFGSLTSFDLDNNVRLMAEAAKLTGHRAIIQAYWEDASYVPDIPGIHLVKKVPHHQVFPRCAAVVHHGGAGVTQSSLWSGCPSVVVAHAFDQPFWARELYRNKVAGKPLHRRSVTPEKLAGEIRAVLDNHAMKEKAGELGAAMRNEKGVKRAVELIEKKFD